MDRSLDEIVAESWPGKKRSSRPRNRRDRSRDSFPRDGVRKSTRDDSRNMDSEWVHDKYEDAAFGRPRRSVRQRDPSPRRDDSENRGTKLRVENLHYELTEQDLQGLFRKIGPVLNIDILYDRAGRSEGTAFVTYDYHEDAKEAIREFDGANAKGQPIRLSIATNTLPSRRNNHNHHNAHGNKNHTHNSNFSDSNRMPPSRSLADRITIPHGRQRGGAGGRRGSRSLSPIRNDHRNNGDRLVDSYVPTEDDYYGRDNHQRSRSPQRRRNNNGNGNNTNSGGGGNGGGRRPGARRERDEINNSSNTGNNNNSRDAGGRSNRPGRPKKTQEELDAEMDDYFAPAATSTTLTQQDHQQQQTFGGAVATDDQHAGPGGDEDVDMIE